MRPGASADITKVLKQKRAARKAALFFAGYLRRSHDPQRPLDDFRAHGGEGTVEAGDEAAAVRTGYRHAGAEDLLGTHGAVAIVEDLHRDFDIRDVGAARIDLEA